MVMGRADTPALSQPVEPPSARQRLTPSAGIDDGEPSLNNLICGRQQRFRDGEAEGFGGLEVYHELEFGRLLDRQIGGRFVPENAPGIDASLMVR
jgi:hypothetical protein